MRGKVVMVTGANAGIGKATALYLAGREATLVLISRNQERGEAAVAQIKAATGNQSVYLMLADMSSQVSIRKLVVEFGQRFDRLDVLVNNAGGSFGQRLESADGIEMTFALNHLGYFLSTHLLLDLLKASAPSRIVCVASYAHRLGTIDLDDLEFKRRKYGGFAAYCQSKLANILFVNQLARRLQGTRVTVNALHPGYVKTDLVTRGTGIMKVIPILSRPFMITPEQGAATSVYLASSPEVEGVSGKYFEKLRPCRTSELATNQRISERLWEISEGLTGIVLD